MLRAISVFTVIAGRPEPRSTIDSGQVYKQIVAGRGVNAAYTTKNQGISAYDPRVIEVTGISMMMTPQGRWMFRAREGYDAEALTVDCNYQ